MICEENFCYVDVTVCVFPILPTYSIFFMRVCLILKRYRQRSQDVSLECKHLLLHKLRWPQRWADNFLSYTDSALTHFLRQPFPPLIPPPTPFIWPILVLDGQRTCLQLSVTGAWLAGSIRGRAPYSSRLEQECECVFVHVCASVYGKRQKRERERVGLQVIIAVSLGGKTDS